MRSTPPGPGRGCRPASPSYCAPRLPPKGSSRLKLLRHFGSNRTRVFGLTPRADTGARASNPSLLTGMVFDESGERLTSTYAVKKGTRYRYYVSTSLITGAGRNRSSASGYPAGNLEGLVINRLRTFLADPGAILDAVDNDSHNGSGCSQPIERSRQVAEELGAPAPDKVKATLRALFAAWKSNPIASTSRSLTPIDPVARRVT